MSEITHETFADHMQDAGMCWTFPGYWVKQISDTRETVIYYDNHEDWYPHSLDEPCYVVTRPINGDQGGGGTPYKTVRAALADIKTLPNKADGLVIGTAVNSRTQKERVHDALERLKSKGVAVNKYATKGQMAALKASGTPWVAIGQPQARKGFDGIFVGSLDIFTGDKATADKLEAEIEGLSTHASTHREWGYVVEVKGTGAQ